MSRYQFSVCRIGCPPQVWEGAFASFSQAKEQAYMLASSSSIDCVRVFSPLGRCLLRLSGGVSLASLPSQPRVVNKSYNFHKKYRYA